MISKETYIANPSGTSSLPFWKEKQIVVPDNMIILHDRDFDESYLNQYRDEQYFKLKHNLTDIDKSVLPSGFELCSAALPDFAKHINKCYKGSKLTVDELERCCKRKVYSPELWIAVNNSVTNEIVGTGIAELDAEIGEGILEWIQVSEKYRHKGIGKFIVNELLQRMKGRASFVTVSGQVNNSTNPRKLYRRCGFKGNDIWHILHKK